MPKKNARGQFAAGGTGGPGRPKKHFWKERHWHDATSREITPEDWSAIVRKAIDQAKHGDHNARAWLLAIVMRPLPLDDADAIVYAGTGHARDLPPLVYNPDFQIER